MPLTMIVACRPLILSYAAYNKVRIPAVFTIGAGIINLILAVILTNVYGLGEYGIAFAFIFALFLRTVIFVPWYAAKVQGIPAAQLYKPVIPSVLAYGVLVVIGLSVGAIIAIPASFLEIMLISGGVSLIYFVIVTHAILTNPERDLIRSILPSGISGILPRWVI